MKKELKALSREISKYYNVHSTFLLAYNIDKKEEIEKTDLSSIKNLLSEIKSKKGIAVLEGIGGNSIAGQQLGHVLRSKFSSQMITAIPKIVASALVYPVLYSGIVLASETSKISPIDPFYYHKGVMVSCVHHLNNMDPNIRKKSRQHFGDAALLISKFISTKGTIIGRDLSLNELEKLIRNLIWTNDHTKKINKEQMKEMGFTIIDADKNEMGWLAIDRLIKKARQLIQEKNLRGCIFLDGKIKEF